MGLITIYAKVKLCKEEDMEIDHEGMGTEPGSAKWVWRNVVMNAADIKRIISYNKTKCVIDDYNGDRTLVNEPLSDVYRKWEENYSDESEDEVEFQPDFTVDEEDTEDAELD